MSSNPSTYRRFTLPVFILCFQFINAQIQLSGFTSYGRVNPGITSETVIKTFQDQRGLIWFCTATGANLFDGRSIQAFKQNPLDSNSMPGAVVTAIQQDGKGRYWFGCISGLGIYDPYAPKGKEYFNLYKGTAKGKSLPGDQIQFLLYDGNGGMWASVLGVGLMKINTDSYEAEVINFGLPPETNVTDGIGIFFDPKEEIMYMAGNQHGLFGIDIHTSNITSFGDIIDSIVSPYKEEPYDFRVSNVFLGSDGTFWLSTRGNDLIAWKRETGYQKVWRFGEPTETTDRIYPIAEDRKGNIWFAFPKKGLYILDRSNEAITHFEPDPLDRSTLVSNTINHIMEDRTGAMWLSTYAGVSKYDPSEQPFTSIRPFTRTPLAAEPPNIRTYFNDGIGGDWFGTEAGLVYRNSPTDSFTFLSLKDPTQKTIAVTAIARLNTTHLLLGATNGLYSFDMNTSIADTFPILCHARCRNASRSTISILKPDTIQGVSYVWAGSQKAALFLINLETKETILSPLRTDTTDGLPDNVIWDIEKDREGKVWVATRGGLRRIDSTSPWKFAKYTLQDGSGKSLPDQEIKDFTFDLQSKLYAVTAKGLFFEYKGAWINALSLIPQMNPIIHNVYCASDGYVWWLTGSEYVRFDPKTGSYKMFEARLSNRGRYGTCQFQENTEGCILLRNNKQLNIVCPASITDTLPAPKTYIIDFQLFDTSRLDLMAQTGLKLRHNQNGIGFYFASDHYSQSYLSQYRWKLEGIEEEYKTKRDRNYVYYSALPPGYYTFVVQACNADGQWDPEGTKFSFVILPIWYQTWWFKTILALAGIGLIFWYFKLREQRLLAEQRIEIEKQIALDQERSRISRDMHDDLGSGLSAIHLLSGHLKNTTYSSHPEISAEIEKIQRSSEELNQRIREIIWTVNTKDDTFQSLITFIRKYASDLGDKLSLPIHVKDKTHITHELRMSGTERKNIFLALKEAVNNAVKHAHPHTINISIDMIHPGQGQIRIHDDGKGFELTDDMIIGNGLGNMKGRMKEIGGSADIKTDSNGTEIVLKFTITS